MDAPQASLFDRMKDRLDWLDQRQRVLAQNIANADTPGYRPNDLKSLRPDARANQGPFAVKVVQTNPAHQLGSKANASQAGEMMMRRTYEIAPAGNAVDLEEQMAKIGETTVAHSTTTALYRKYLGLVKTVLNAKG
jgi:flagellar basal-body rod protein FlgB